MVFMVMWVGGVVRSDILLPASQTRRLSRTIPRHFCTHEIAA
jgi:hypothetical protein